MSDRTHQAKGDRIQQLQQQIEAWQALQDKVFISIDQCNKNLSPEVKLYPRELAKSCWLFSVNFSLVPQFLALPS